MHPQLLHSLLCPPGMLLLCGEAAYCTDILPSYVHKTKLSHVPVKTHWPDSKWCLLPLLTASGIPCYSMFQFDVSYSIDHRTVSHTSSVVNAFDILIKICLWSIWCAVRHSLRTAARGCWTCFRCSYAHPSCTCITRTVAGFWEIQAWYPSLLSPNQHFSEEWFHNNLLDSMQYLSAKETWYLYPNTRSNGDMKRNLSQCFP